GLQLEQVPGLGLAEFFHTNDPDFPPLAAHRRALEGEASTYSIRWAGRVFQCRTEPLLGEDGEVTGCIGVAFDVTELKRAEQALQDSETKYRSLLENLEQCVFLKDTALRFVAVNAPFCRAVGRAEADILGKTDLDLYPPELAERNRAADRQVLARGAR